MNEQPASGFPLADLITIRTYGTWLHGDEKGSVDRHGFNTYGATRMSYNEKLKNFMKQEMKEPPFYLNKEYTNFNTLLIPASISPTIAVIKSVATKTIMVDCCNCSQLGHVTFSPISL